MKKEVKFYLGMDVSKSWVDLAVMCVVNHVKEPVITERFDMQVSRLWING